jgi:hypothetical protein
MGRPIYNYELSDPDFSWLISSFKENNPHHAFVDTSGVPISFINANDKTLKIKETPEQPPEEFQEDVEPVSKTDEEIIGETK